MDYQEMSEGEVQRLLGKTCEWKAFELLHDIDSNIFGFVIYGLGSAIIGLILFAVGVDTKAPGILRSFGELFGLFLFIGGLILFVWAVKHKKKSTIILGSSEFTSIIDELRNNDQQAFMRILNKIRGY